MKVVLITGCSSGIGLATAEVLAKNNYKVYATLRDLSKEDKLEEIKKSNPLVEILQLDVTDEHSVKRTVDEIISKEGRIDVLINNAGYGLRGTLEMVTIEEAKQQFDTNFFGLIRVTQHTLPHMRKEKGGHIINISSVAGVRGMPASDLYAATKFAVEAVSESMVPVLSLFGIKVTLVEPGPVTTDFPGRSLKYGTRLKDGDNPYKDIVDATTKRMHERFKTAQDPYEVAQLIKEIIEMDNPNFRYQTREDGMQIVASKFVDTTGNSLIERAKKDLLESLNK